MREEVALPDALASIREREPLVQQLTNEVTKNDLANVTLHWGGLPVMADAPEEAPQMAELAGAMLLNTGRMTESNVRAMREAGRAANELGVPVVLDPVGVGATPRRTEVAEMLLEEVEFAAVKGNYGEVSALAGADAEVKGVESVGEYADIVESARALAAAADTVVVCSGETDLVVTADAAYSHDGGHRMMGRVVGTGCMLGSTLATFCGGVDDPLAASLCGVVGYGLAGERAAELDFDGPASYKIAFLDSVANLARDPPAAGAVAERTERLD